MYDPQWYDEKRQNPERAPAYELPRRIAALIYILSAFIFALAIFGFLDTKDAEAQLGSYSIPNGTGGMNYYVAPPVQNQWLNLGIHSLVLGQQAQARRDSLKFYAAPPSARGKYSGLSRIQSPDGRTKYHRIQP